MKVFGIPMALLLLLLCAARVSAGVGSKAQSHRHPHTTDNEAIPEVEVEPSKIPDPHVIMAYGRAVVEAVVVGRPNVDFGSILQQGDAAEILMALCHPSRLIRSILLSWVATEAWRKSGLFRSRKRQPKNQQVGKRYRRVTTTTKTYKKEVKGVIEEPLHDELFQQQYASSRREQRGQDGKATDTFSGLVPESQEKANFLTKSHKERLLKKFEVKSPGSRHKPKTGKKRFKFLRLTREKKFRLAWALGHILSPFLLTPIGGAVAGWTGVVCVGAELIPWVEAKLKLNVLEDNELLEWLVELFRNKDVLKAVLFGSFAGGIFMKPSTI